MAAALRARIELILKRWKNLLGLAQNELGVEELFREGAGLRPCKLSNSKEIQCSLECQNIHIKKRDLKQEETQVIIKQLGAQEEVAVK